ncbi:MAG: helix-turn-helix domain-containing protein [Candidatus Limnocylindrales bacterium]
MRRDGAAATSAIAERLGYPTTTARRALEDLAAHGIADPTRHRVRSRSDLWCGERLDPGPLGDRSRNVRRRGRRHLATVPEMSERTRF